MTPKNRARPATKLGFASDVRATDYETRGPTAKKARTAQAPKPPKPRSAKGNPTSQGGRR